MERVLRRLMDREDGLAMVTAVIVVFIVVAFSTVLVQLSVHNSQSSAVDRGRVAAVNAAEGGIDITYWQMERYGFAGLPCTKDADLTTTPTEHYHVAVAYYAAYPPSGTALTCPLTGDPAAAVITSTGMAPGATAARVATRTMQSEVRLSPIVGIASFQGTVYGVNSVSTSNTVTIDGYQGNDANVYTRGVWSCSNSATIQGTVFADSVNQSGTCTVNQDVWSKNSVQASGLVVGHDVTSSRSSITLSGSSHVTHNATSGTSCSGCTTRVSGTITTNHISPDPPLPTYPNITYNATDWTKEGYTITTFSNCNSPTKNFILDPGDNGKHVVRITPACNLQITSQSTMTVRNDIAIITDGNINVTNKFNIASADGQPHTVYWIVPAGTPCGDINFNNAAVSSPVIRQFFYGPAECKVTWTNSTGLNGQIFGGTVSATNTFDMNYRPIQVPGFDQAPGYQVDIAYIREIAS